MHPDGSSALESAGQWHSSEGKWDISLKVDPGTAWLPGVAEGKHGPPVPLHATFSMSTSKVLERLLNALTPRD